MNDEVTISADGEDEIAAIDSLTKLIESKFGEE
jgi:phosphotransferase system HPr-like phosphotransfer protein